MAELKLKTVTRSQGNNQALKDGTVKPRSFAFDFEEVDPLIAAFRRMVRGNEFDICEMAITTYICAKAHGKPMTAVPVFLVRAFHHGAILVNAKAGIRTPKDLEGRKVGVNRGYTVTTALEAGLAALRQRGHYPINHTVVIKDALIAKHPDLAADVFDAFARAKRHYVERLKAGRIEKPTEVDEVHRRVMAITGEPLPYGIAPNRHVIEALIGHALTQGIITRPVTAEELFAPSMRELVG